MAFFIKNKWKRISLIVLVIALLFSFNHVAYAEITPSTGAEDGNNKIFDDLSLPAGFSNYPSIRAFPETTILCYDNYADLPNQTVVMSQNAPTYQINNEKYRVHGCDGTNACAVLTPVPSLSSSNNITAVGEVNLIFSPEIMLPANCVITNDTLDLEDLTASLNIPNNKNNVDYGRVLYRTIGPDATVWGSWHYISVNKMAPEVLALNFNKNGKVQIVVILEFRETYGGSNHYYRLKAIYRFNIEGCNSNY